MVVGLVSTITMYLLKFTTRIENILKTLEQAYQVSQNFKLTCSLRFGSNTGQGNFTRILMAGLPTTLHSSSIQTLVCLQQCQRLVRDNLIFALSSVQLFSETAVWVGFLFRTTVLFVLRHHFVYLLVYMDILRYSLLVPL